MKLTLVLLIFTIATQHRVFGQSSYSVQKEQTGFSTEGEVVHNIPLPASVRGLLEQDPLVRETLQTESPPLKSLPEDWTECSVIHLADNSERDYVVIGQRSLVGAHATHFWVYRQTPMGTKLVLAAFADALSLNKRSTRGLRDITVTQLTAVGGKDMRYVFDGNIYRIDRTSQYHF